LNLNTETLPSGPIPSHRRIVGPFIILAKRIMRKIMMPYSRLVLREQITFNARLQTALREVVSVQAGQIDFLQTSLMQLDRRTHELNKTLEGFKESFTARSDSLDGYLQMLQRRVAEREADEEQERGRNRDTHQQLQEHIQEANHQVQESFRLLEERHRELFQHYLEQRQENLLQKRRLDFILAELRQKAKLGKKEIQHIVEHSNHLRDHQYFLFENKFRGPREKILKHQELYLPLFREVRESLDTELPVLDVGCGRGEFLEMLRGAGIPARGIELNEDMVHVCKERGLDVCLEDAFHHLQSLPDESLAGVMASHFIEHLETNALVKFITLCHCKIRKGGLVAIETPNPLTLLVSANYFWLDLSHMRPIHPEALRFLMESCGFLDPRAIYLSPCNEEVKFRLFNPGDDPILQVVRKNFEMLNDYFFGEQDYAVTARK